MSERSRVERCSATRWQKRTRHATCLNQLHHRRGAGPPGCAVSLEPVVTRDVNGGSDDEHNADSKDLFGR